MPHAHFPPHIYAGARHSVLCYNLIGAVSERSSSLNRRDPQIWEELTQMLEEKLESQEHYAACAAY